jgi:hypothetical protein
MHRRGCLVASLTIAGCLDRATQTCGSVTCPLTLACAPDGIRCVLPQQYDACRILNDDTPCSVGDVGGICKDRLCELFECGDGVRNGNEACDGVDLGGADCRAFGYANPEGLVCRADCRLDRDACGDAIQLVAHGYGYTRDNFLPYEVTVPAGEGLFMLVSVQVSALCSGSQNTPSVIGVEFMGKTFAPVTSIVGTPCSASSTTRSEQWMLVAPPAGTAEVGITLTPDSDAPPIHSAALVFSGVNQVNPIRATAQAKGSGMTASVDVSSAPHDVVVDAVGQGFAIDGPSSGQTAIFVRNRSSNYTLDNTAASWRLGQGPTVTMSWTFAAPNEWQLIASSLQPR